MGLGNVQNFFRGAGLDKLMQHFTTIKLRIFNLAPQFAIGKGTCTALPKLHIGFWVQGVFAPQAPGILGTLPHCFSALEDNRLKAHLRQQQCCENTARAKANDDWPLLYFLRCFRYKVIAGIGRRSHMNIASKMS